MIVIAIDCVDRSIDVPRGCVGRGTDFSFVWIDFNKPLTPTYKDFSGNSSDFYLFFVGHSDHTEVVAFSSLFSHGFRFVSE